MSARALSLRVVLAAVTLTVALLIAGSAQAIVVDLDPNVPQGTTTVTYPADQNYYYGVAMVPGTDGQLANAGIPTVSTDGSCYDPYLSSDLGGPTEPSDGLCFHNGGNVIHQNETFAFTWDPDRRYFAGTRDFMEKFLADVAASSGMLGSQYALTPQYQDAGGRAGNVSQYGGGCIDFGSVGGYTCTFGDTNGAGTGHDYPATNDCPATGTNYVAQGSGGAIVEGANDLCITDFDIQGEVTALVNSTGLLARTQSGYTPLVVILTPPGVVDCLNTSGTLCSANSNDETSSSFPQAASGTAQFCSYHGVDNIGGAQVAYVVQPWTSETRCDEPDAPVIPANPQISLLDSDAGAQMVSPLSQGEMAAITNPDLNGWFSLGGAEMNDNYGCVPFGNGLDTVTVNGTTYYLQREFNNAGVLETDFIASACSPFVTLSPTFVLPTSVSAGDEVQFDGSTTESTLIVPKANYNWNFGDGITATGPSVTHAYTKAGNYTVVLTVTDRGGYTASSTQTLTVAGKPGSATNPGGGSTTPAATKLRVLLQLLPQSRKSVLSQGVDLDVFSNEAANGIVYVYIPHSEAKKAHMRVGHDSRPVRVGVGTLDAVAPGLINLRLHFSRTVEKKLRRLPKLTLTVKLRLKSSTGDHLVIDAAGRY